MIGVIYLVFKLSEAMKNSYFAITKGKLMIDVLKTCYICWATYYFISYRE